MGIDTSEISLETHAGPKKQVSLKPRIATSVEMRPEALNIMKGLTDHLIQTTGVVEDLGLDQRYNEPEFFQFMVMHTLSTQAINASNELPLEDQGNIATYLAYLTPCRNRISLPLKPKEPNELLDAEFVWQDRIYWAAKEFVAAAYPGLTGTNISTKSLDDVCRELRFYETTQGNTANFEEKQEAKTALDQMLQIRKAGYDSQKQPTAKNILDYKRAIGEMRKGYLQRVEQK